MGSQAVIVRKKTGRSVQFGTTGQTPDAVAIRIAQAGSSHHGLLLPGRAQNSPDPSTRLYVRAVKSWPSSIGLEPSGTGTP